MKHEHASGYEIKENRTEPWSLWQLQQSMFADLNQCQSEFERINCRAIAGREIREKAMDLAKVRKLTPGEIAIASEFGYRAP